MADARRTVSRAGTHGDQRWWPSGAKRHLGWLGASRDPARASQMAASEQRQNLALRQKELETTRRIHGIPQQP